MYKKRRHNFLAHWIETGRSMAEDVKNGKSNIKIDCCQTHEISFQISNEKKKISKKQTNISKTNPIGYVSYFIDINKWKRFNRITWIPICTISFHLSKTDKAFFSSISSSSVRQKALFLKHWALINGIWDRLWPHFKSINPISAP